MVLNTYNPPTFVDDNQQGPFINAAFFNDLGIRLADVVREVNALQVNEVYSNFATKANGPLSNADSGQQWISVGPTLPVVYNGKIGFPNGSTTASSASYAMINMPKPVSRIRGKFRFDASTNNKSNVTLGAFSQPVIDTAVRSSMHLSITPTYMEFSVGVDSSGVKPLPPVGQLGNNVIFLESLKTDGVTEYEVDIILDRFAKRAYVRVGHLPVYEFHDDGIQQDCRYAFWETFVNQTTGGYGGWTEVYADTRASTDDINAMRGMARPRPGWSASNLKPNSRVSAGATWFDQTANALTFADGYFWRDFAGGVWSNLIPTNFYQPDTSEAGLDVQGGTKTRVLSAPEARSPFSWKLVSNGASVLQGFNITSNPPGLIVGQTYSFMVDELKSLINARQCIISMRYYDTSYNLLTQTSSSAFTVPNSGKPISSPVISLVCPTNAVHIFVMAEIQAPAVNDEFTYSRYCLARGVIGGYVQK